MCYFIVLQSIYIDNAKTNENVFYVISFFNILKFTFLKINFLACLHSLLFKETLA